MMLAAIGMGSQAAISCERREGRERLLLDRSLLNRLLLGILWARAASSPRATAFVFYAAPSELMALPVGSPDGENPNWLPYA
jgi:hypothetical protein